MKVGLVGCVKSKLARPAAARDLYISPLFRGRRSSVERSCDRWFVLSAEHGLVDPSTVVAPYDVTLTDFSAAERHRWSSGVIAALTRELAPLSDHHFEIHAGAAYSDFGLVDGLQRAGGTVAIPTAGLALGQQLQFYAGNLRGSPSDDQGPSRRTATGVDAPRTPTPTRGEVGAKYATLAEQICTGPRPLTLSLAEIDGLVGGLPRSAYVHRAWWANDPTHSHARAWLACGRAVTNVDSARGLVTFS